jgi:CDP-glycerol glycerophosphotransferase
MRLSTTVRKGITTAAEVARQSSVLRKGWLTALSAQRRALRAVSAGVPVRPKRVMFESYGGRSYACSPKALYKEMMQDPDYADYEFIWAFRSPENHAWLADRDSTHRTRIVKWRTLAYYRAYFSSRVWIVNALLPLELPKKPSQFMVQTWHGSPLKRLRTDIVTTTSHANADYREIVRRNALDVSRWDLLLSPSSFTSSAFASAFDLRALGKVNILAETGYPRNTSLFRMNPERIAAIRQKIGVPDGKKAILYTPTWREHQYRFDLGYVYDSPLDFTQLRELLGDEYVILFRGHYQSATQMGFEGAEDFVLDVSSVRNVNSLYAISEMLITDYSSTFFDFMLLDRPVLFYMHDADFYAKDLRGFYLDMSELPGDVVHTQAEVEERLQDIPAYEQRTRQSRRAFRDRFDPWEDALAPAAALRIIRARIQGAADTPAHDQPPEAEDLAAQGSSADQPEHLDPQASRPEP